LGGAAGAAPQVLGWAAVTGEVHAYALILFLIIFVWTPPHFWALAIYRRQEYAGVGLPMLPVTHGVEFTRWQILFYTIMLVLVTLLPYLTGMSGLVYLAGVGVLNAGFLGYSIALLLTRRERVAMDLFSYSILYLLALFAILLIDHYLTI
jgi:protoheme IX farnesyltransferase